MKSAIRTSVLGTALTASLLALTMPAMAQEKVKITLARFFGACDAEYGASTDVANARGECGIITTLINKFNAESPDVTVVPQIIEWDAYYDQLTGRIMSKDIPTIAVMHMSRLGDFVARNLLEPQDDSFKAAGINVDDFTTAARTGVTLGGKIYAMPFDTHAWLWHYNTGLLKQAGLVTADGKPMIPSSPEQLFEYAKKFKDATGKNYLLMASATDGAAPYWTFLSLLGQQGGTLFPKGNDKADMKSPEAKKAMEIMKAAYTNGTIKPNQDGSAAMASFLNGEGAIAIDGTWRIDSFMAAGANAASPLSKGYNVYPFPKLLAKEAAWGDGHSWVMLKGGSNDKTRPAAAKFMKYLYEQNFNWARTGHLPIRQSVINGAEYQNLPHRKDISAISKIATNLPAEVKRKNTIQVIIGEETNNVMLGEVSVDVGLDNAETRINDILSGSK